MKSRKATRRDVLAAGVTGAAAAALTPRVFGRSLPQDEKTAETRPAMQHTYVARDYSGLVGMPGFNEALLRNHFKLYEGYVKNVNRILADLEAFRKDDKLATPAAAELRRRLGWEFDGMRLHEIYFDNLGGKEPLRPEGKLGAALVKQWGSIEAWMADFKAVGEMRGIGWAALVQDGWSGRLYNVWIEEHDGGHFAACPVLLLMDVFEHAYLVDNASKKAEYIDAFFRNVDWTTAERRLI